MSDIIDFLQRRSSLDSNAGSADENISAHGTDWLWAAFCIFACSFLVMAFMTFTRPTKSRTIHQMALITLAASTFVYFSMASDLGNAPAPVEFRGSGTRQVWYVRYIQWFFNYQLLLLVMLLGTGLSLSDILTTLFMGVLSIVSGLVGSLVLSTYKWGYFTFGCCGFFYVWYVLLWYAPRTTTSEGGSLQKGYMLYAGYFSFMLITYPICWACCEGANVITPTAEMIWYGVLDIFAGPVFLALFFWSLRGVDFATYGSSKSTEYNANPLAGRSSLPEKKQEPTPAV